MHELQSISHVEVQLTANNHQQPIEDVVIVISAESELLSVPRLNPNQLMPPYKANALRVAYPCEPLSKAGVAAMRRPHAIDDGHIQQMATHNCSKPGRAHLCEAH